MLLFSNPVFGGAGWLVLGGCNQPPSGGVSSQSCNLGRQTAARAWRKPR